MTQSNWSAALGPEPEPMRPVSEPAPKRPRKTVGVNSTAAERERSRVESFLAAALAGEIEIVRTAPTGTRNNALNISSLKLGSLIAAGLNRSEIIAGLTAAAQSAGLTLDEISKTIQSGMAAGEANPRSVPPAAERAANDARQAPAADEYQHTDTDDPQAPPSEAGEHAEQAQPKVSIEIVDSAAIFAPLEEPDWLIDGVIRRGSLVELVGYGSSGKSWIAIDALLAVAAGGQWLGRFNTQQGAVLGLDWENGLYEMRRRIQAVAKARQLWDVQGLGVAPMPAVYMSDPKFGRIVESLAATRSLMVIDTLKAATPGVDENDSSMRGGLDALRRVGEKTNCAFLVLVHSKKTSGSLTAIDAREAGRGSSAIFDAADSVLHVTYAEGEPLRIQQTKSRQGRQVEPFQVTIEDGEDGAVAVTAKDATKADPHDGRAAYGKVCDEVLEIVKESPGASGRVIRARVKCRPGVVAGALETLESNGVVRNTGTESKPKWFPTGKPASRNDEWSEFGD